MSVPDPELGEQCDAFNKIFDEASDKNDASAMLPLFTKDVLMVSNGGAIEGHRAIGKYYADKFESEPFMLTPRPFTAERLLVGNL
jgi:hypothetical protein